MSGFEIVGGIKFKSKDIAAKECFDNKYSVNLADGTTLDFVQQAEDRFAEVELLESGRVEFRGIENATIIDTPMDDVYVLCGCRNVTVAADAGTLDGGTHTFGMDQDFVEVQDRTLPNGKIQRSENNTLKLNKDDLYQLSGSDDVNLVNNDSEDINA